MRISEPTFVDTNILVFACDKNSPLFDQAVNVRNEVMLGNINAYIAPQVLYEFYAVITSPKRVINPLSTNLALKEVKNYMRATQFKKIYPLKDTTMDRVFELVDSIKLIRTDIFDAHIAAVMLENGVTHILTDNEKDFVRFKDIKVTNPFKIQK